MNARISCCIVILFLLSGCGAIANPTPPPVYLPVLLPLPTYSPLPITETATLPIMETSTATPILNPPTKDISSSPTNTLLVVLMETATFTAQAPTAISQVTICQAPQGWVIYTVQRNDTLSALGQRTGTSIAQIQTANCLAGTLIFAGQSLYLPYIPPPPMLGAFLTMTPFQTLSPVTLTPTLFPTLPPPGPSDPTINVMPASGPPGTQFVIQIEDFKANESITIEFFYVPTLATVLLKNTTVDNLGNLIEYYLSPANAPIGDYTVEATGTVSAASGEFKITNPP